MSESPLPKPKIEGIGHIVYRCHTCGELITDPDDLLLVEDPYLTSHHAHHLEETPDGR
jgi:hypothetical protein